MLKQIFHKFSTIILFFVLSGVFAQNDYKLQKTNPKNIIIDGVLNPEEWGDAVEVDLNIEITPGNNIPASIKTTGYLTYSDTHLYVGFYAYNDPKNIRASIRSRDDFSVFSDDVVLIRLDTYTDARNNYILVSNPFGSQMDVRAVNALTDDKRYDRSFNLEFETEGSIVKDGYHVEFKIPFSTIPFPNAKDQLWHFNFYRKYFDDKGNEIEVSSQIRDRDNSCEICQTTDRLYMDDIKIEKRVELLPYVAGNIAGQRPEVNQPMDYGKFDPNVGLGLNLDLSKNSVLEVTINPDFSQVEADVTQIDVNSPIALIYPERRPFFNRGTDIVNFTGGAFYSRSINNPLVASKLLSQGKKSRVYFLSALDQDSPYLIGGEDRSYLGQGGQSFVNVFRYQRLISQKSRVGLLTTNRYFEGGGYGNLIGTDGLFLLGKNWRLSYEVLMNFNKEPIADWIDTDDRAAGKSVRLDGDQFSGDAIYLQLYRNTEHWKSYLFFRNIAPDYQADVGFVVKNNRRWLTFFHQYQNFANKKALQFFSLGTKADVNYTFDNNLKAISVDAIVGFKTLWNTEINYTYDFDVFKNYLGRDYHRVGKSELDIMSSPSESFSLMLNMTFGKDLAYNEDVPDVGREITAFITPSFQVGNKFNVKPSLRYARLRNLETNDNYFEGYIGRLNLRYQFNNFLSVRLISEYNDFTERFFIQPLVQWNPNPSTVFYIGGNQNSIEDFNSEFNSPFRIDQNQIYLKFQYLIGL